MASLAIKVVAASSLDAFGVRGVGEYASGVGGVEVLDGAVLEHPLGVRRCGG